jgi:hypothetical protein
MNKNDYRIRNKKEKESFTGGPKNRPSEDKNIVRVKIKKSTNSFRE